MGKLSQKEEKKVIDQLKKDIESATENEIDALNAKAIKAIYTPEKCRNCGDVVSMLTEGLCGRCAYVAGISF
jgi:hypothetical protein